MPWVLTVPFGILFLATVMSVTVSRAMLPDRTQFDSCNVELASIRTSRDIASWFIEVTSTLHSALNIEFIQPLVKAKFGAFIKERG